MNVYKQLDIKNKLLFMFVLQLIVPVLIFGSFFLVNVKNSMKDQALTMSQDMLKVIEIRIQDFSKNIEAISQDLLYDVEIYKVLRGEEKDPIEAIYNINKVKNVIRTSTLSNDGIQSISIYDFRGNNYKYDFSNGQINNTANLRYGELLAVARENEGRPTWYMETGEAGSTMYLSRIINDIDTFNEIGLLVIEVNTDTLEEEFSSLSSALFKSIHLIDESGQPIVNSNDPFLKELTKDNKSYGVYYEDVSMSRMISYREIESTSWTVFTVISSDVLFKEVNGLVRHVFLIFMPLVLLLSAFNLYEGAHMVGAIHKIVDGMRKVSKGEKQINIHVDRKDEIGFLSDSFNDMSNEIEQLIENVESEQVLRKEGEIKALQAQINPHFLYNTLETINWHAQLKGVPEISDMVTALSSIMEATIGKGDKLISFREELLYVENYLSIMVHRFEDRFTFSKSVENSVLGIKVPRLILQPIIENAVNHGIGKSKKTGEIHLSAKRKGEGMLILIRDNGVGMSADKLDQLRNKIYEDDSVSKSIGLKNVNKRLYLFYGEGYGITVKSEKDLFTEITLKLGNSERAEGDRYYV